MNTMKLSKDDQKVGRIAGAIFGDLSENFPHPPLLLVPLLTFKVKNLVDKVGNLSALSDDARRAFADDLAVSVAPVLFSLDISSETIERMVPIIESAALRALTNEGGA